MVNPVASPSDVQVEYATFLSTSEIRPHLDRAAREIRKHNDVSDWEDQKIADLEASYTAYRIATRSDDRAEISASSGRTNVEYEEEVVEILREEIWELDESGELVDNPNRVGGSYEVY